MTSSSKKPRKQRQSHNETSQFEWAENFVTEVTNAGPAAYNMDLAELTTASTLTTAFRTQFDLAGVVGRVAVNPAGYTQPGRAALYTAAQDCIDTLAEFAVRIQADSSISDQLKINAGIVPRNFTRAPRTLPAVAPTLQNKGSTPGVTTIRAYNDVGGVARPEEANGVMFETRWDQSYGQGGFVEGEWFALSDPVVGNIITSTNPPLSAATRLNFRARYFGSRGQVGPWSVILSIGNL